MSRFTVHVCMIIYTAGVDPRVTLTHNLTDGHVVYDTQRVIFFCTIIANQATTITWSSDEYIGTEGVDLQLTSDDPLGFSTSNQRDPTTVVTLINTTRSSDGVITVTTSLQLVTSAQYPTSRITCKANGHGPNATVAFQTTMRSTSEAGKPKFT